MALKKKINFNKVKKQVIDRRLSILKLEANNIISEIVERTLYGKDVNNRGFKRYSKQYGKWKRKGYGSRVNLKVSGNMLDAIDWKELKGLDKGIRLYLRGAEENAKAHGSHIKNRRKFLGVDPRQRIRIAKRLRKLR